MREECDGVLVFTDLLGGTPFNQAMMIAQDVDSVLFDGVIVNRRARVYKAILDKNVVLTENSTVGIDTEKDLARGFTVTPEGITVVPKGTIVDD